MPLLRASSRLLLAADYRVETFGSEEEFLNGDRSEAAGCVVIELQEALAQSEESLPGF